MINTFNEQKNIGESIKQIGKIQSVELEQNEKKTYLIIKFKIKNVFNNIIWDDLIKNKLRLTKGNIEKGLKDVKIPGSFGALGISALNNNNAFYTL